MTIAKPKDKQISHLQKLISRWENLLEVQPLSNTKYYELYERSKTALKPLYPDDYVFWDKVESPSPENSERLIGKLRAVHLDLNDGILSFEYQIQSQMAIDLMQQAEELLVEGKPSAYEHIPAAVLAGAVLENFLRTLCGRQSPPIPIALDNGNLKTLATLVNDLEKIELYNDIEKHQLKVWVKVRNAAAHGQFDQFNYEQVKNMIEGIKIFIEKHQVRS